MKTKCILSGVRFGTALCVSLFGLGVTTANAVTIFDSIGGTPASLVGNPGSLSIVHSGFAVAVTTGVDVVVAAPTTLTGVSLVVSTDGGSTADWRLRLNVFSSLSGFEGGLVGDLLSLSNVPFVASPLGVSGLESYYLVQIGGLNSSLPAGTLTFSVYSDVTTAPIFYNLNNVLGNIGGANGWQGFADGSPAFPTGLYGGGDPAYKIEGQVQATVPDLGNPMFMLLGVLGLIVYFRHQTELHALFRRKPVRVDK